MSSASREYICVFGSSSTKLSKDLYGFAFELGELIARSGMGVVFGAGRLGLMGSVADGALSANGQVVGVIPEKLHMPGIAHPDCHELVVTPDMHTRKAEMEKRCAAFIALPGGFGTLEELLEVITLKQLGYHSKPVVICNPNGFFDCLIAQFEETFKSGCADEASRALYRVADDPKGALACALKPDSFIAADKMRDWK